MYKNQSIIEIIEKRKSTRIFSTNPISSEIVLEIKDFIKTLDSPFDNYFRIELFKLDEDIDGQNFGSYGMIKNAKLYVGIAVKKEEFAYENLGFVFEKLILFLTSLGLGTCWFGGNLKGSKFEERMNLKDEEVFPIMSPIGYSMENPTFAEKLVKVAIGSNKRKNYSKLFFENNFNTPLENSNLGFYSEALKMLRQAPSAINLQPWRVIKIDNKYHFYTINPKKINHSFYIQRIDLGIAISHFYLTLEEKKVSGKFVKSNPNIPTNFEYIISWEEC